MHLIQGERERQIDREFAHENTMAKINELAKKSARYLNAT